MAIRAALVALLIWLPRALSGDYYEIGDPLFVMGIPIIVVSIAIGALIGVPPSHPAGGGSTTAAQRSSRTSRTIVAFRALTAGALAILFFLWNRTGVRSRVSPHHSWLETSNFAAVW